MPPLHLLDRLRLHASERPDAPAYRQPCGGELTWRQLAERVSLLSATLQALLPAGSVVILSARNQLEYPAAFLAIIAAGCTVFPVSAEAAEAELLRAASESRAVAVIGDERAVQVLIHATCFAIRMGGTDVPVRPESHGRQECLPHHQSRASAGDLLLQSSGTTGLPKIARRTGASLDAVAAAMAEAIRFTPQDRVLMTVPLTHSYGLEHGLLAPVWAGSCVHLCRGLDLSAAQAELSRGGITVFPAVPAAFEMLAGPMGDGVSMPTLRVAYAAGAPLPRSVFDTFLARFNIPITQLYGATEIGSVAFNAPWQPDFNPASVGQPMRDVSIRILDPSDPLSPGTPGERVRVRGPSASPDDSPTAIAGLPPNTEGQVAIRAPSMFTGYLNAASDLIDGFYPTGDLGYLDPAGRLFITGRIKLLIDIGGMKVNPLEVEAILQRHPQVAACVVVPVRQSETIFRLKAILTPADPAHPPPVEELRRLARENLAAYKVPRVFEFRPSLPRSPTGKVLRHLVEMP